MQSDALRIMVVDDDKMAAHGMAAIIKSHGFEMVGIASNGIEGVSEYERLSPDMVFMDICMPFMNGVDATRHILKLNGNPRIVGVTGFNDLPLVKGILLAGALGLLWKPFTPEEFLDTISCAMHGKRFFSPHIVSVLAEDLNVGGESVRPWINNFSFRENQILSHVAKGRHNKEIAMDLNLSIKTIDKHIHNIKKKLGAKTIAEMIVKAVEQKILILNYASRSSEWCNNVNGESIGEQNQDHFRN